MFPARDLIENVIGQEIVDIQFVEPTTGGDYRVELKNGYKIAFTCGDDDVDMEVLPPAPKNVLTADQADVINTIMFEWGLTPYLSDRADVISAAAYIASAREAYEMCIAGSTTKSIVALADMWGI